MKGKLIIDPRTTMASHDEIKIKHKQENEKLKNITENHDAHIDEILPDYLHRGDIVTTNRLLGYTDAMMATCATFLVLPFRNLKEMNEDQTLEEYMYEKRTEFIMFFIGFLVICTIWESTNIRSIVIKRLDDFMVLLSILLMLGTTILPFSLALQGTHPEENVAVAITTIVLIAIEVVELIMIFYGFASPRLLHYALSKWSVTERKRFRTMMILKPIFNFFLAGVAGLFCLLDYHVSWVLFSLIILTPLGRKLFFYVRRRMVPATKKEKSHFYWFFTKGNISKERVEVFTDAATAIIACVLILDITVEDFPPDVKVEAHGLTWVLKHMNVEFKMFFATYIMVSLLWYVNHTILHLFHTITVVTLYLQKIFLVFLCLTPLYSNMLAKFITRHDENTHLAVVYASLLTFASSSCNFLMLLWGFYRRDRVFHKWASNKNLRANLRQHLYVILKTINIPFWSFIVFLGSFTNKNAPAYIMITAFLGMLVTFIILKIAFLNHIGKHGIEVFEKNAENGSVGTNNQNYVVNEGSHSIQMSRKDSSQRVLDEEMKDSKMLNEEFENEEEFEKAVNDDLTDGDGAAERAMRLKRQDSEEFELDEEMKETELMNSEVSEREMASD